MKADEVRVAGSEGMQVERMSGVTTEIKRIGVGKIRYQ